MLPGRKREVPIQEDNSKELHRTCSWATDRLMPAGKKHNCIATTKGNEESREGKQPSSCTFVQTHATR
jgi:hypothetical protein